MSEKFIQSSEQPAWQDISLAEVEAAARVGDSEKACRLAKLRLRAIELMPAEIATAIARGVAEEEEWVRTKEALEKEIKSLKEIIELFT